MQEKKSQSKERGYRLVKSEGKITWNVEELWDGGVVRGPFGSREAAIRKEEDVARTEGFIDDLVLKEAVEEQEAISDCVVKDTEGNWRCIKATAVEIDNRLIALTEGTTFTKGVPFMGVYIAEWLDEHST